jgi:hypothetical protein
MGEGQKCLIEKEGGTARNPLEALQFHKLERFIFFSLRPNKLDHPGLL